jgi:hypothetical protein
MLGQSAIRTTERYAKHQPDHLRDAAWVILRKHAPRAKVKNQKYESLENNGGRDWDRTSDPYDVNVVLSR